MGPSVHIVFPLHFLLCCFACPATLVCVGSCVYYFLLALSLTYMTACEASTWPTSCQMGTIRTGPAMLSLQTLTAPVN